MSENAPEPFDDQEFKQLLDSSQLNAEMHARLATITSEFRTYLEVRGVDFDEVLYSPWPDRREDQSDFELRLDAQEKEMGRELAADEMEELAHEEIQRHAADAHSWRQITFNHLMLNMLATHYLMIDGDPEMVEDFVREQDKKKLQAEIITKGYGEPWLEMIDQKFPGEPLNDDDHALIIQALDKSELKQQERHQQFEETLSVMRQALVKAGMTVTVQEEKALNMLAYLSMAPAKRLYTRATYIEKAQTFLRDNGYFGPVWQNLINDFFV